MYFICLNSKLNDISVFLIFSRQLVNIKRDE